MVDNPEVVVVDDQGDGTDFDAVTNPAGQESSTIEVTKEANKLQDKMAYRASLILFWGAMFILSLAFVEKYTGVKLIDTIIAPTFGVVGSTIGYLFGQNKT